MANKKKCMGAIALAVVVLAGGYLYLNFGSLITRTAEKIASDALGVKVNIGSIDVSLSDKKVTVSTIQIGNPPGYRKPYAMTADKITIGLNTASKQLIDFKDIEVKGSVINLEVNEKGMNLDDLKKLANRKEQKQSVGSEQVRVIIRHMVIDAAVINPSITLVKHDIKPITMPPLTFSNIGKGNGVNAGEAVEQVLTRYFSEVQNVARQQGLLNGLPGTGDLQKTLDGAASGLKNLFK